MSEKNLITTFLICVCLFDFQEVRESLNIVKGDVNIAVQQIANQGAPSCPPAPEVNFVSTTFFVILLAVQMVALVVVLIFRYFLSINVLLLINLYS